MDIVRALRSVGEPIFCIYLYIVTLFIHLHFKNVDLSAVKLFWTVFISTKSHQHGDRQLYWQIRSIKHFDWVNLMKMIIIGGHRLIWIADGDNMLAVGRLGCLLFACLLLCLPFLRFIGFLFLRQRSLEFCIKKFRRNGRIKKKNKRQYDALVHVSQWNYSKPQEIRIENEID